MTGKDKTTEPKSVTGSAGYYEKSIDSLPVAKAVETPQQQSSSDTSQTATEKWGDVRD